MIDVATSIGVPCLDMSRTLGINATNYKTFIGALVAHHGWKRPFDEPRECQRNIITMMLLVRIARVWIDSTINASIGIRVGIVAGREDQQRLSVVPEGIEAVSADVYIAVHAMSWSERLSVLVKPQRRLQGIVRRIRLRAIEKVVRDERVALEFIKRWVQDRRILRNVREFEIQGGDEIEHYGRASQNYFRGGFSIEKIQAMKSLKTRWITAIVSRIQFAVVFDQCMFGHRARPSASDSLSHTMKMVTTLVKRIAVLL